MMVIGVDEFAARKGDPGFAVDWKARNAANPPGWPMEMGPRNWQDEYDMYLVSLGIQDVMDQPRL